jgi:hypothetical protein
MGAGKEAPAPLRVLVPPQPATEMARPMAVELASTLLTRWQWTKGITDDNENLNNRKSG